MDYGVFIGCFNMMNLEIVGPVLSGLKGAQDLPSTSKFYDHHPSMFDATNIIPLIKMKKKKNKNHSIKFSDSFFAPLNLSIICLYI